MTDRQGKWLWALALLLLAALGLTLAFYDDSLGRVTSRGVLRVGYAVEAPYAMPAADGNVIGEAPATTALIAARMGVKRIEWVRVPFSSLIPSLLDRRFDMIAAGMFITPERRQQVLFSRPTLRVISGLLVRKGNPKGLVSYASLTTHKDLRIAVLNGAVESSRLQKAGVQIANLVVVPDAQSGIAAVGNGTVDALALSLPTTRWISMLHANRYEAVPIMKDQFDRVGMAFNPVDKALWRAWNEATEAVIGSSEHLAAISVYGFTLDEIPPDKR